MEARCAMLFAGPLLLACVPVTLRPVQSGDLRAGVISYPATRVEEAARVMKEHCAGRYAVKEARPSGDTVVQSFECEWNEPKIVSQATLPDGTRHGTVRFHITEREPAAKLLMKHCEGGVTEISSTVAPRRSELLHFLCGDSPEIRAMAEAARRRAEARTQEVPRAVGDEDSGGARHSARQSLRFGVIDHPERGRLEVGSSHRLGSDSWEFVLAYTNATGAPFREVTVECITLEGSRVLNANTRTNRDGINPGEQVIFKIPVADSSSPAELATCRVSRAAK